MFSDINRAVVDTTDIIYNRIMSPWLWPDWIFYIHSQGRSMRSNVKTLHRFSENVIDERIRYKLYCMTKCKVLVTGPMKHAVRKRDGRRIAIAISLLF